MKRVLVVIPMYGNAEMTDRCVALCRENAGIQHDILVVDDGSPEPYFNEDVHVLRLEKNSGFTAAVNSGILWASDGYEYVHLMNNDTEPHSDFLKALYDAMEAEPAIGIAGSVRLIKDPKEGDCYEMTAADLVSGYQTFVTSLKDVPKLVHTYWVPLCSAMIRHSLIREIGLLDKNMRMWCSDNDYCIRAGFAGWNVTLVPASVVYHIHQATTGKNVHEGVKKDQDVLMAKIMNVQYAVLLDKMPLDQGSRTYGKVDFKVYKK